ncbi:hypothetical protein DFH08DRAFT_975991 [Mycena albidolilacea]|uniref:Novel STAND NTPase 1 domain-containing protein n=1 Tax=Mycena albidolilacea TaxID=1033008 RepID=A0AAD6Z413_9AGAR|nr:hypothetical protein DFH08DRAFT_975991 [Mycena albidolilacea]
MAEMKISVDQKHNELLEHLASRSQNSFSSSSSSLSILLPGSPKIFRGRELELQHIVSHLLSPDASCSAILGSGGIGKTSLALAALYHPDVVALFGEKRYFIPLDSARSPTDLLTLVASYFGLDQQGKVTKTIIKYLSTLNGPSVLVLDNFESPWEAPHTRSNIEDLLSQLADVPRLHLIVTMRGAERPMGIRWSRPFIQPLETLNRSDAKECFLDIVDHMEDDSQLDALLDLTDNVPLVVTLLANITSYEGAESVLSRWSHEATSILSEGLDKGSNLDKSIKISLSSPRITSLPNALQLLSLLSLLPDGIPEGIVTEISLPFDNVVKCRVALVRTSLAYIGQDRRIKLLTPIREYVRITHPPSPEIFRPLKGYICSLVHLSHNFQLLPSTGLVQMLSNNLGNIRTVLMRAMDMYESPSERKETIVCVIELANFSRVTNLAPWSNQLTAGLLGTVKSLHDKELLGQCLLTIGMTKDALQCFIDIGDVFSQIEAYLDLSSHHVRNGQIQRALDTCHTTISLAQESGDMAQLAQVFIRLSQIHRQLGHSSEALKCSRKAWLNARMAGSMLVEARAIREYACCCVCVGDYAQSKKLCGKAWVLLKAFGMQDLRNHIYRNVLNLQAEVHYLQTDFLLARELNVSLLGSPGKQHAEDKVSDAYALINIARSDIQMGRCSDPSVITNINTARDLMASNKLGIPACDIALAELRFRQGKYSQSASLCADCLSVVQGKLAEMELVCWERLADIGFAEKDTGRATRFSIVLLALALRVKDLAATHQAFRRIGDLFHSAGDGSTARNLFELALSGFTLMDIHQSRGNCLIRLGDISLERGEYEGARDRWTEARSMFDRSSQLGDVQRCNERLGKLK